ncbi:MULTISPECIES: MarR family winged helix-turn-helix transcriptional regulator [Streptomycetaceae]|uniref:HTH marR-type domain-containing protein n=1 Tax=Streptantibioticus cattleyicolor (strain ATCC 35852 / DSM 46488 / JCM 4925 / NBRC 14057 / NRRL 8057) TaxID=1003195 RepID=F8JQJ6_STREN|nr:MULTISPECIES: MarR family transcriptional regulator [Streptomycetaceae]AEW97843.1 hypothetical protein SCATT_54720 [Streptantibioticus cattleyicolor NRRL 8057 = DSM 46488]MYS62257.1 MarR family transcriptional regulator [Streptomyces sp. SID5468]CCB78162.1 conserved protein of unknown function [Streptantibioticus cattleyicolor NRRL 8057 = DSM 46488]
MAGTHHPHEAGASPERDDGAADDDGGGTPARSGPPVELVDRAIRLATIFGTAADAAVTRTGLTRADMDVLLTLHRAPGPGHRLKPSALAASCGLSSGGTSNIIRRLATVGYLTREADEHDGRSTWCQLTAEGARLAKAAARSAAAERDRLLARLPPRTAGELTRLLGAALEHLEAAAPAG